MSPQVLFPEFAHYPQLQGVFVGGCVERGDGSSFRRQAHAHTSKTDPFQGWVCVRSPKRLRTASGKPSMVMLHELAHILTGHGHDDTWRRKVRELGGRINYWETKEYYQQRRRREPTL